MKRVLCSICALIMFTPFQVRASELESLLKLDISDLTKISVASKKQETIKSAPSVISVITKEDIRRFGANNLRDVLVRLPGFQTYASHFLTGNALSVRGTSNQHYFSRGLFLINGRQLRGSTSGGNYLVLQNMFPVESIQRIEVIRGPGSVLYGTGAFSSVINIVTEQAAERDDLGSISVSYGGHNYQALKGEFGKQFQNGEVVAHIFSQDQDGWDTGYTSENGSGEFQNKNDGYSAFVRSTYKDLTLNAFYGSYDFTNLSISNIYPSLNDSARRLFTDVGYKYDIQNGWKANLNSTYNLTLTEAAEVAHSNDLFLEAQLSGPVSHSIDFLTGIGFDHQNGKFLGDIAYNKNVLTWYAQSDFALTDWLKIVSGLQYNKVSDVKGDFSPRFAAIVNLNEDWTFKALHSEAYRDPAAVEEAINVPNVLVSDSSITAETIATNELQLMYQNDNYHASVTYYNSLLKDKIGRQSNPLASGLIITNRGSVRFEGLEFESKFNINDHWLIDGSFTWQKNEDSDDIEDSTFTPNIMAKLGVSYQSKNGWGVGIFDSFFGEPTEISNVNPSVSNVNPSAESYHWVTANVNIDINKVFNNQDLPKMSLSLFAENLAGEDVYYPEFNRKNVNSFPSYIGGPSLYARLKVNF